MNGLAFGAYPHTRSFLSIFACLDDALRVEAQEVALILAHLRNHPRNHPPLSVGPPESREPKESGGPQLEVLQQADIHQCQSLQARWI